MVHRKSNLKTNRKLMTRRKKPQKGGGWGTRFSSKTLKDVGKKRTGWFKSLRAPIRKEFRLGTGVNKSGLKFKGDKMIWKFKNPDGTRSAIKYKINPDDPKFQNLQNLKGKELKTELRALETKLFKGKHDEFGLKKTMKMDLGKKKIGSSLGLRSSVRNKKSYTTYKTDKDGKEIINKVTNKEGNIKTTSKYMYNNKGNLKTVKKKIKDKSLAGSSLGRGKRTVKTKYKTFGEGDNARTEAIQVTRSKGFGRGKKRSYIDRNQTGDVVGYRSSKGKLREKMGFKQEMTQAGIQRHEMEMTSLKDHGLDPTKLKIGKNGKWSDSDREAVKAALKKKYPNFNEKRLDKYTNGLEKTQKRMDKIANPDADIRRKMKNKYAKGNEDKQKDINNVFNADETASVQFKKDKKKYAKMEKEGKTPEKIHAEQQTDFDKSTKGTTETPKGDGKTPVGDGTAAAKPSTKPVDGSNSPISTTTGKADGAVNYVFANVTA